MGISYRRAWFLLDSLNNTFDLPATLNSKGGRGGGGSEITPFGVLLIDRYREVERRLNEVAGQCLKEIRTRVIRRRTARPALKVPVSKHRRKEGKFRAGRRA